MLTTTETDGRIEAVLDGEVDAAGFEALRDRIEAAALEHGPVRLLVTVRRFSGIGPKALLEDLRSMDLAKRIHRYAVVTDIGWLRAAASAGFAVVPLEARAFTDRSEALAWLKG